MKFDSKITLSRPQIEEIVRAHLEQNNPHKLIHKNFYWHVSSGGTDGFGGYDAPSMDGLEIAVELNLP